MTTQTDLDVASHKVVHDERVKERNRVQRMLIRPEMGALIGAVAIFIFFLVVAPPFRSARSVGHGAVCQLDDRDHGLCGGVVDDRRRVRPVVGGGGDTSSLAASMLAYNLHLNLWVGAALALVVALGVGFLNGYLVMKTKIPSFLITLGTLLMLTGINLAVTKLISGQVATPSVSRHGGLGFGAEGVLVVLHHRRGVGCGSRCCGGCCSPRWRPMCCSRPGSVTGFSPSAVIRKVPARSVCR